MNARDPDLPGLLSGGPQGGDGAFALEVRRAENQVHVRPASQGVLGQALRDGPVHLVVPLAQDLHPRGDLLEGLLETFRALLAPLNARRSVEHKDLGILGQSSAASFAWISPVS